MPLARLSIKSATKFARDACWMRCVGGTRYVVRRRDGRRVNQSRRMTLAQARERLRVDRIFVSLVQLGVPSTEALPVARLAAVTDRDWASIVGDVMERREVVRARCLYPTCDCGPIEPRPEFACAKGLPS